ncbi:MAG: GFA family protein [Alphaproteobacteria bacterium]
MSDESDVHEGGCLCGKVRYRVTGKPRWVAHCHCQSCRRASGGAAVTWAGYTNETYEVTKGAPVRFNSSPGVTRGFCGDCGSPMTYESGRWPAEVHVTLGTLDSPDAFPPKVHVYAEERLPWLRLDEHLESYAKTSREERE